MICKNCGNELKEGAMFCGNCGAELTTEGKVVQEKKPEKKMSLKKKIVIGVASFLIILGGVGLIWGEEIVNKLMFSMPAETQLQSAYYNFAEEFGKESGILLDEYKKTLSMDAYSTKGTIAIRVSDAVKKMIGLDIDELDRVYLDYEVIQEEYDYGINLGLGFGETYILSLNIIVDYEEGTITFMIPELSDKAIVADMEYDLEMDMSELGDFSSEMEEFTKILSTIIPESNVIEEFIPKYVETIIKAIDVVDRKEATLTVGGVSQKATALTVDFDEKMVEKIAKAISKKIAKDATFKSYMRDIYEFFLMGEEFDEDTWNEEFAELIQDIESGLAELKNAEIFQKGIKFVTWVDSDNQIIGIELADVCVWKSVESGSKVASEITITDSGKELMRISVEGTEKEEGFSGDVALCIEGEEFIKVEVAKWLNTKTKYACDAKLVLDDNFMEQLTGSPWVAGDITLQLVGEGDEDSSDIDFAVLLGENELAAFEFATEGIKEGAQIERPSESVEFIYINDWVKNIDIAKILDNLEKAGFSKLDIMGYLYEFGLY